MSCSDKKKKWRGIFGSGEREKRRERKNVQGTLKEDT